jgi:hypothetical protein
MLNTYFHLDPWSRMNGVMSSLSTYTFTLNTGITYIKYHSGAHQTRNYLIAPKHQIQNKATAQAHHTIKKNLIHSVLMWK